MESSFYRTKPEDLPANLTLAGKLSEAFCEIHLERENTGFRG
ncbi:hypothetical protein [Dyadobacter beijingensis]|nr:hypothetical protein [Dyadobacter beijingensis]